MGLQQGPLGRLITTKKLGHVDGAQTKKVIRLQKSQTAKNCKPQENQAQTTNAKHQCNEITICNLMQPRPIAGDPHEF
jgi:hypothetical protein